MYFDYKESKSEKYNFNKYNPYTISTDDARTISNRILSPVTDNTKVRQIVLACKTRHAT